MSGLSKRFIRQVILEREIVPDFHEYPFHIPSICRMDEWDTDAPIICLVGENGMGKSTLLEAIAVAYGFNPEGGSWNFNFSSKDSHSVLHQYLKLVKGFKKPSDGFFLRAESFYNVSTEVERLNGISPGLYRSYGGHSLHECSHGEGFIALVQNRFSGNGLYLLDEPESALSPNSQLLLLMEIHRLIAKGSQFFIATHSPILMAYPGALVYRMSENGIRQVDYKETDHFQIMKYFISNPERYIRRLLEG